MFVLCTGGGSRIRERPLLQQDPAQDTHLVPGCTRLSSQVGGRLCYNSLFFYVGCTTALQSLCSALLDSVECSRQSEGSASGSTAGEGIRKETRKKKGVMGNGQDWEGWVVTGNSF